MVTDLFHTFVCCCVVGKAPPGASINVHLTQHFAHAEGEIFAALTFPDFCYSDLIK